MNKILYYLGKMFHGFACLFLLAEAHIAIRRNRLHGFLKHTMDPAFDYKKYKRKVNPYFRQWGFKFSMVEAEYYRY